MERQTNISPTDDEIDLLQLVETLWRGKWIVLFCASIAIMIGGYYAYVVAVPKYLATTTIALQMRGSQVVDIESVVTGVSADASSLNTEIEVIRSRKLGEQLVRRLELTNDPEFNPSVAPVVRPWWEPVATELLGIKLQQDEKLVEFLFEEWLSISFPEPVALSDEQIFNNTVSRALDVISVNLQRNTFVFSLSAKTTDPQKSVLIINSLADLYIADQIAVKFEATENAVNWLSERVTELEVDLKSAEDRIKSLKSGSNLITPETLAALNQQANNMNERLVELERISKGAEERLEELEDLRNRGVLSEMQDEFSDPILQRLYQSFLNGEQQSRELFFDRFDLLVQRDVNDLQRAISQAEALEGSYDRLQLEIEAKTQELIQLQQAEREADATRVLYETFLSRLKETTVQRGLQEADARVLSPAINGRYVEPQKPRIIALSFLLGAMIGVGIIFLRQFLHNGFRTAEELEKYTGITVMGQIPNLPISKRRQLIGYLNSKPTSAAAEAIRNLRTSVLLSNIDAPPQVIMSTSSIPGEGKTTQAIALAQNFAGLGKKVLLMECDIRRRTFNQYFKTTPDVGLVSALAGEYLIEDIILYERELGVDILIGEKTSVNAADLFSSDRFQEFMGYLRKAYDIIIIDTPPVLVVPDARIIAQFVDAIVYSVKWDQTTKSQVDEGIRQFATANIKIAGFVLSQIDPKGMRRYGYGGKYSAYGAYARYGKKYYDN